MTKSIKSFFVWLIATQPPSPPTPPPPPPPPSRSQNSPPEGNGVHFMFEVVSRLTFSEESDGADHFLKKGAQHAHFGPFFGPNSKALLFDIFVMF